MGKAIKLIMICVIFVFFVNFVNAKKSSKLIAKKNVNLCSKYKDTIYRSSDSMCVCSWDNPMSRNTGSYCSASEILKPNTTQNIISPNGAPQSKNSSTSKLTTYSRIQWTYFFDYNNNWFYDTWDNWVDWWNLVLYSCNDQDEISVIVKSDYYWWYVINISEPWVYKILFVWINWFKPTYTHPIIGKCFEAQSWSILNWIDISLNYIK